MNRHLHSCNVCGGRHYYGSKPYLRCQRRAGRLSLAKSRAQPTPRRATSRTRSAPVLRAGDTSGASRQPRAGAAARRRGASPQASSGTAAPRRAKRNAAVLQRRVGEHTSRVLAVLQDPSTGYEAVAEALLRARPLSRRFFRRHELCVALNDLAEAINPATYATAIGRGVRDALLAGGVPAWVASALAGTSITTLMLATGTVDPTAHLRLMLRALILLLCPDLERCPTRSPVCTTLAGPGVAQQLRLALPA